MDWKLVFVCLCARPAVSTLHAPDPVDGCDTQRSDLLKIEAEQDFIEEVQSSGLDKLDRLVTLRKIKRCLGAKPTNQTEADRSTNQTLGGCLAVNTWFIVQQRNGPVDGTATKGQIDAYMQLKDIETTACANYVELADQPSDDGDDELSEGTANQELSFWKPSNTGRQVQQLPGSQYPGCWAFMKDNNLGLEDAETGNLRNKFPDELNLEFPNVPDQQRRFGSYINRVGDGIKNCIAYKPDQGNAACKLLLAWDVSRYKTILPETNLRNHQMSRVYELNLLHDLSCDSLLLAEPASTP